MQCSESQFYVLVALTRCISHCCCSCWNWKMNTDWPFKEPAAWDDEREAPICKYTQKHCPFPCASFSNYILSKQSFIIKSCHFLNIFAFYFYISIFPVKKKERYHFVRKLRNVSVSQFMENCDSKRRGSSFLAFLMVCSVHHHPP